MKDWIFQSVPEELDPRSLNWTGQNRTATIGLVAPGSCSAGLYQDQDRINVW